MGIFGDALNAIKQAAGIETRTPEQILIDRFERFMADHGQDNKIKFDKLMPEAQRELDELKKAIHDRANAIFKEAVEKYVLNASPSEKRTDVESDRNTVNIGRAERIKSLDPDIDESKLEFVRLADTMSKIIEKPQPEPKEIPWAEVADPKEFDPRLGRIEGMLNEALKDFGVTVKIFGEKLCFEANIDDASQGIRGYYKVQQKNSIKMGKPQSEYLLLQDIAAVTGLASDASNDVVDMRTSESIMNINLNKGLISTIDKKLPQYLEGINNRKREIVGLAEEKDNPQKLTNEDARVERVPLEAVIAQLNNVTSEIGGKWGREGNRLQMDINEIPGGAAKAIALAAKDQDISHQSVAVGIVYDALNANKVNVAREGEKLVISLRDDGAYAAFGNSSKIKKEINNRIAALKEKIIDDRTIRVEEPKEAVPQSVGEIVARLDNVLNKVGFGAQQVGDKVIITIPDKLAVPKQLKEAAKILTKGMESRTGLILDEVHEGLRAAGINSRRIDEGGSRGIVIDESDFSKVEEKLNDKGLKSAVQGRLQDFIERGRTEARTRQVEA